MSKRPLLRGRLGENNGKGRLKLFEEERGWHGRSPSRANTERGERGKNENMGDRGLERKKLEFKVDVG